MSVMAFHEKAGRSQVLFCLPRFHLPFLAAGFSERPGAVKGAFCAAQRTLDGEDRSATMPLERKVGPGRPVPRYLALRVTHQARCYRTVATLPSALWLSDVGSVQVGCSRFSRCCHLLGDLSSILKDGSGPGHRRSHRNSALGFCCTSANYAAATIVRFVLRSGS
jgi:hypothetical protein